MFSTASAQTAVGTVKLEKNFITTPDGELKITVEDIDLNDGVIQRRETAGRNRRGLPGALYVIREGTPIAPAQLLTFRTARAPIKSATPWELYNNYNDGDPQTPWPLSNTDTDPGVDFKDVVLELVNVDAQASGFWNQITSETTPTLGAPDTARHPYTLENAAGGAFTLGILDERARETITAPVDITFTVTYKAPDQQDASIKLTSTTDNNGVQVKIPETGPDTAKFERTFQTATSPQTTHIVDLRGSVREDQITLNLDGSGCNPGADGKCTGLTAQPNPLVVGSGTSQRYGRSDANDANQIMRTSFATTTTEVLIGIDLSQNGEYETRSVDWIDVRVAPGATIPPGARLGWLMNPAPSSGTDTQKALCEANRTYLRLVEGGRSYADVTVPGGTVDDTRMNAEGASVRICWTGTDVRLAAAPGALITATYDDDGLRRVANATVETTKPTIRVLEPAHNAATRVRSARLIAEITDADSGVDAGNENVNIVFDPTARNLAGGSVSGPGITVSAVTTVQIQGGVRAEATLLNVPTGETEISWKVIARDIAGNVAQSDQNAADGPARRDDPSTPADETNIEPDLYKLRIDTLAPDLGTVIIDYDGSGDADPKTVNGAITGNYLDDENNIVTDATKGRNTSIRMVFNEDLDAASVQQGDFRVNGVAPVAAATKGRSVFLTVPTFASDARPAVRLAGPIADKAGNIRPGGLSVESAQDGISPTITVTVNPDYHQDEVTINVQSNEALLTAPVIRLSSNGQDDLNVAPTTGQTGLSAANLAGSDLYRATFKPSVQPFAYNVNVDVLDTSANPRSTGKAKADDKDSITAEIDKSLPAQTSVTLPGLDPIMSIDSATTYKITTRNPFMTIEWDSEAKEYGRITDSKGTTVTTDDTSELTNDASKISNPGTNKTFKSLDTHGTVDFTNLKIKVGEDTYDVETPAGDSTGARSEVQVDEDTTYVFNVTKPTKNRLLIAVRGLELGTYEMSFNGRDELGNTRKSDVSIKFEVKDPDPFEVKLNPGWNLVSLPATPDSTAINDVIPADHPASVVLTYDPKVPGAWLSANRGEGEDRSFTGTLTDITAGVGYWIFTDSFESFKVQVSASAGGDPVTLPTINLVQGWNLIPVLDVTGTKKFGADRSNLATYIGGSAVRAYQYNGGTNRYTVIEPTGAALKIGTGYWVYMSKAEVIVP